VALFGLGGRLCIDFLSLRSRDVDATTLSPCPEYRYQLVVSTGRRNTQVEPDFMKAALEPFSAATLPEKR
jgi:hypothetical protein